MYLVPTIRDLFEVLNNVVDSVSGDFDLKLIIEECLRLFFVNLKSGFTSLTIFQWIQNFPYFPISVPQLQNSLLTENLFLDNQISTFLRVLQRPAYTDQRLISGFLNSFFFSLPFSSAHLMTVRRLLIQGIPPAIFSALGTITGQFLFATCILFGLRSLIIPWLSFDFNYLICILILLQNISDTVIVRRYKLITIDERKRLKRIFLASLILSWTEQFCTFQYFGNLTFGPEPTALEIFQSNTEIQSYLLTATYLYGFLVGTLFFTAFFGFITIRLSNWIYNSLYWTFSKWYHIVNYGLISFTIALAINSISYYGTDYMLTPPLGFTSQDPTLYRTVFCLHTLPNRFTGAATFNRYMYGTTFNTDLTDFDRGTYLRSFSHPGYSPFEGLNFEAEHLFEQSTLYRHPPFLPEKSKAINDVRGMSRFFVLYLEQLSDPLMDMDKMLAKLFPPRITYTLHRYEPFEKTVLNQGTRRRKTFEDFDEPSIVDQTYKEFYATLPKNEQNFRTRLERSDYDFMTMKLRRALTAVFTSRHKVLYDGFLENQKRREYALKFVYKNEWFAVPRFFNMRLFTLNQPTFQKLTPSEENLLFQKRLLLGSYYDSFRYYNQLPHIESFKGRFNLSKSYANRIYSQKFKGTSKIVRRVFSITASPKTNKKNKVELKFDQPLFLKKNEKDYKVFHEELSYQKAKSNIFLKIYNPTPFYAGWDQGLRQVVITNRLLPRSVAGYRLNSPTTNKSPDLAAVTGHPETKEYRRLANFLSSNEKIPFTKWPLSLSRIDKEDRRVWKDYKRPFFKKFLPYNIQFEFIRDPNASMTVFWRFRDFLEADFTKLKSENFESRDNPLFYPTSLNRADYLLEPEYSIIPPTKGGYIWPGNTRLNRPLVKLIKKKYELIMEKPMLIINKIKDVYYEANFGREKEDIKSHTEEYDPEMRELEEMDDKEDD